MPMKTTAKQYVIVRTYSAGVHAGTMAAQPAFKLPDPPSEYAIGVNRAGGPEWLGVARGFPDLHTAGEVARRELGDSTLSTCPIDALSYHDRAIARRGRVVVAPLPRR